MSQFELFALVVIAGIAIFPFGFEIAERLSIRAGQIPARGVKEWQGMPFLHWKDFNAHKFGDSFGMVPMIGFIAVACAEAHWTALRISMVYAILVLAAVSSYLWVKNVRHAMKRGKIARRDWGFYGPEAKPTIAGRYHSFVVVLRLAAIGMAAMFIVSHGVGFSLAISLALSFAVFALTALFDMRTINFASGALFVWALLFALIEIGSEGGMKGQAVGWALLAPTFHTQNAVYGAMMNGKELTGYHMYMFVLPFVLLHLPFAFGRLWGGLIKWTLARELEILALFFLLSACWDGLWFVLNPSFTLDRFRPGEIWWHAKWIWRVPTDYVSAVALAAVFTVVVWWRWDKGVAKRMATALTTFALGVSLAVFFAPVYIGWYSAKVEAHGGLTETWKKFLSPGDFDELAGWIGDEHEIRAKVSEMVRKRAQCEQLHEGCP
jgi:hypothetical protein